jgi:DNA-binding SARP family transcriptional activator
MENIRDESGLDNRFGYVSREQWQDTLKLLRILQNDYEGTRNQLDQITRGLSEKEFQIDQYLQYLFTTFEGYHNFSLTKFKPDSMTNQIGKIRLAQSDNFGNTPKILCLDIKCLGRFEIQSDVKLIERWQSVKAKSVLLFLLTKPREPILKEALIEALWPDCSTQAANNNLKAAIYGLRQTLGFLLPDINPSNIILFTQGSYIINPEIDLKIDVEEFEKHFNLGRRFEKELNYSSSILEYQKAESLYFGDYLEDEPYQEWTMLRRERLKDNYLFIVGKLADQSMKENDWESCVLFCLKILEKETCREDAYQRLICCYSRMGLKNRALRWYEICAKTLQNELNSTPDPKTSGLFDKVVMGEQV